MPSLQDGQGGKTAFLPLCCVVLPAVVLATNAFRLDTLARRRAKSGACQTCGYNLTGLPPSTLCPECGGKAAGQC